MTASARPLHPTDPLDAVGVGDDTDERCLLDAPRGQPRQDRIRMFVAGEATCDKSTLLPGRDKHDVHDLAKYVTQAANPGNRLGIAEAVLRLRAPLLADGVELDRWRGRQEQRLTKLTALDRRPCDRLARDLDTLHDVADLLGVAPVPPQDGGPLVANPRFPNQFAEEINPTERLAGWIRRHLADGYGTKRPRAHHLDPVREQQGSALADRASTLRPSLAELTGQHGGTPVARRIPGR